VGKILLAASVLVGALQAQTVTLTPSTLTFTYQSGSALPKAQSVSVKVSAGKPSFITAIAPATAYWLTASPNSGTLPGSVSVMVNPTSLPEGQYIASVTLTVLGVGSPAVIGVTLNITAPPSTLSLSATSLTFTAPPNPAAQTIALMTDGAPISFTATAGAKWLTVSPTVGVVLPGDMQLLTVTVDASALTPQVAPFTAKITVVASGASVTAKSQNVTVNLTVINLTPTITNIWPPTLPVNAGAQTLTIRGTNFYSTTVAEVQGVATALTTTVLSSTALLAVVPAAMLTVAGSLQVMVQNPAPGGASVVTAVPIANTPVIFGVVNSASYASATVSPGELVTIFGSNIGPPIAVTLTIAGGYVNTTLSNVTVTIDAQSAPILYVSSNQVTVQVPYEVTLGAGKAVVLTNGANPAANSTVTIGATEPGIYTADGSGAGQAAALNTNSLGVVSLNSGTNPAPIGETVSLYLTGEGNYNLVPLSGITNTGYVIPIAISPLPQMATLPTVMIGGVDASAGVSYAGVVPGSMIGVLQINVVVPAGSSTGAAVPVVVTIGGNTTQANVTLGIHP